MHVIEESSALAVIRAYGELRLAEVARIAAAAARARAAGRAVVLDLSRVTHLHYAGARLLGEVPGIRAAGASRYVRDLCYAGGGFGRLEFHRDVAEAVRAS
ncbi:MAG TPA: anti-anti-sigma factor [Anaeromyxobacteraceae bacterium]|nr:anti-anti-sigma factor [Anaeromyxobacteraceae bacterium]